MCVNEKLLRNFRESCDAEARKNERKVAVDSNESLAKAKRQAVGFGAVVLDEEDHEAAMDALQSRAQ